MKFKLRHMEVFRAVMLSGSINGAARMLHKSQPGLSKTIAYLEQSLGIALFTRTKSALVPTKEAQILFAEICRLYTSALEIDQLVDQLRSGQQGQLTVATSPSFALGLVPETIKCFLRRRPDSKILCRSITASEAGTEILGRRSELVISTVPVQHSHLSCRQLFTADVVCLLPRGHPLEACTVIDLQEATRHPMILYDAGTLFGRVVREAFEREHIAMEQCVTVTRTEQACALVQAGLGLTLASSFSTAPGLWSNIVMRPIAPAISLPVTMIHSAFDKLSPQAEDFVDVLESVAKASASGWACAAAVAA